MGEVVIKKLDCFGRHGVLKEENVLGQRFFITCVMETDFEKSALEDNIEKAVNYAEVASFITTFVKDNVFKLIETLADKLATNILLKFNVNKVTLTIEKPSAPVGLPLETVSVKLTKKWNDAYLSIGSNMGDKKAYLDFAVKSLKENEFVKLEKISTFIETEPYGNLEQDSFLNGALKIKTVLSPTSLLKLVNEIELKAERKREIHWGPRTLDIDIVLFNNEIICKQNLIIPHIDMENRAFVLKPLCEISPYAINPVNKKSVKEMLENLK